MSESDGDPWARPAGADAPRAAAPVSEAGSNGAAPRLGPRPLDRPAVDAESATAFARPDGVSGAFSGAARPRVARRIRR